MHIVLWFRTMRVSLFALDVMNLVSLFFPQNQNTQKYDSDRFTYYV